MVGMFILDMKDKNNVYIGCKLTYQDKEGYVYIDDLSDRNKWDRDPINEVSIDQYLVEPVGVVLNDVFKINSPLVERDIKRIIVESMQRCKNYEIFT